MNNYTVYRLTSPNGKFYIGITNDFKRRFKEHRTSKWPIGRALRKHGYQNFKMEFLLTDCSLEEALRMEEEMIGEEQVKDKNCYNLCLGGLPSLTMSSEFNPMRNPEIVKRHPAIWTSTFNPMFDPKLKQRMIESQNCKKVIIDEKEYYGVREAARQLGVSRQMLVYRLKSDSFPSYRYIG
jgi:predicted GIY-YIG superfamily endonuclease